MNILLIIGWQKLKFISKLFHNILMFSQILLFFNALIVVFNKQAKRIRLFSRCLQRFQIRLPVIDYVIECSFRLVLFISIYENKSTMTYSTYLLININRFWKSMYSIFLKIFLKDFNSNFFKFSLLWQALLTFINEFLFNLITMINSDLRNMLKREINSSCPTLPNGSVSVKNSV